MAPPPPTFNTSKSQLAVSTADGRLKIIGVASQRLAVDLTPTLGGSGPTAEILTALSWGAKEHVAVGTAAGAVRCLDVAGANSVWTTVPAGVEGGVAALACAPDADRLLVLGRLGGAAVLRSDSGAPISTFKTSQEKMTAAALLSGGRALLVGANTTLVDVASGSRLAAWTAHSAPVVALALPTSEACLVSAGDGERTAAVFNLATGKKGKLARKAACATLSLRCPVKSLAVCDVGGAALGETAVAVAALLSDGALEVFVAPVSAVARDAPAAQGRLVARAGAEAALVAVAAVSADQEGCTLVLASGSAAKPVFQTMRVAFAAPGSPPTAIEISTAGAEAGVLVDAGAAVDGGARHAAAGARVVGAEEVARAGLAGAGKKRAAQDEGLTPQDEELPSIVDADDEGPTLGEKVAALRLAAGEAPTKAVPPAGSDGSKRSGAGAPSAASLSVLLSQALRSEDKALLEKCLAINRDRVITATVGSITAVDAAALLKALVTRLGAAPARGEHLAMWVRATLRAHAGSLLGMPGMAGTLSALNQQIEMRLASHQQLLSLAGRLDLVLAQAARAETAGAAGVEGLPPAPVRVVIGADGDVIVENVLSSNGKTRPTPRAGAKPEPASSSDEDSEDDELLDGDLTDEDEDVDGEDGEEEDMEEDEEGLEVGSDEDEELDDEE